MNKAQTTTTPLNTAESNKISFEVLSRRWQSRMQTQFTGSSTGQTPPTSPALPQSPLGPCGLNVATDPSSTFPREKFEVIRKASLLKICSFMNDRVEGWDASGEELKGIVAGLEEKAYFQSATPQQYARKISALLFNVVAILKEEKANLALVERLKERLTGLEQLRKQLEQLQEEWEKKPRVIWAKQEKDLYNMYHNEILPLYQRAEELSSLCLQTKKTVDPEEFEEAKLMKTKVDLWLDTLPTALKQLESASSSTNNGFCPLPDLHEEPPGQRKQTCLTSHNETNIKGPSQPATTVVPPKIAIPQTPPRMQHQSMGYYPVPVSRSPFKSFLPFPPAFVPSQLTPILPKQPLNTPQHTQQLPVQQHAPSLYPRTEGPLPSISALFSQMGQEARVMPPPFPHPVQEQHPQHNLRTKNVADVVPVVDKECEAEEEEAALLLNFAANSVREEQGEEQASRRTRKRTFPSTHEREEVDKKQKRATKRLRAATSQQR